MLYQRKLATKLTCQEIYLVFFTLSLVLKRLKLKKILKSPETLYLTRLLGKQSSSTHRGEITVMSVFS